MMHDYQTRTIPVLCVVLVLTSLCHCHRHVGVGTGQKWEETIHDKEHLLEHLSDTAGLDVQGMTHEEMHTYHFLKHDFDGNRQLDGLELLYSFRHILPYDKMTASLFRAEVSEMTKFVDDEFVARDLNNDGYLTYAEYSTDTIARTI